jgi:hypothetical protein
MLPGEAQEYRIVVKFHRAVYLPGILVVPDPAAVPAREVMLLDPRDEVLMLGPGGTMFGHGRASMDAAQISVTHNITEGTAKARSLPPILWRSLDARRDNTYPRIHAERTSGGGLGTD